MKYVCLVYSPEDEREAPWPEEPRRIGERELEREPDAEVPIARSAELQPISTATTVRVRDGKTLVTDGPYAETRDQLQGFFVLECERIDEALAWAASIPAAERGAIEVRPENFRAGESS